MLKIHHNCRANLDKALQLLEFLIKNGSERVIDDARSHISLLKMLRQFHFIDQNGKDQGVNVRNRSKELAELLSDVDRIRAERKKARTTRNKYGGAEGGMGMGGSMSGSGSRYGGFGSEEADGSYGGFSGGVYGDGGGFGGNTGGFSDTHSRRDRFEEYDEYDEGAVAAPGRRKADAAPASTSVKRETQKADPPKPKEPEVDLFSFGDEEPATTFSSNGKQKASVPVMDDFGADDDEFDDFQAAPPSAAQPTSQPSLASIAPPASTSTTTSSTQFAAPQPRSGTQGANINDLFASISPAPSNKTASPATTSAFSPPPIPQQAQQYRPAGFQASQPNYYTSVPLAANPAPSSATNTPGVLSPSIGRPTSTPKSSSGGDAFSSLLAGTTAKKTSTPTQKITMADMAKQKASAGIWGAPTSSTPGSQSGAAPKTSSAFDDLLG